MKSETTFQNEIMNLPEENNKYVLATENELHELFKNELKNIYHGEQAIVSAIRFLK